MMEILRESVAALSLNAAQCHNNHSNDDTCCNRSNNIVNIVKAVHKNGHQNKI